MVPAGIFLAVQFVFCAAIAVTFGFYHAPPFSKYFLTALSWAIMVIGVWMLWNLRHRPESPISHLKLLDWSRHRNFAFAMALLWLQFVALTWGKAMLPVATSMWADVPLANLDTALFGADAWKLLPPENVVIDAIYMAWLPTVGAAYAILYFSRRRNRNVGLLAFFLTMGLLGTLGQFAFPSGGPIFFQRMGLGDRFADIPYAMQTRSAADWLWEEYSGHYIGYATGISAFPSMHVAVSSWIGMTFRNWLAISYALFIFFASIMLGWHYAVDGIAGAIGAALCYSLAKVIVSKDWSRKSSPRGADLGARLTIR
jgi:hypothetical protein